METLQVALGDRSYPIHIGPGLLGDPALIAAAVGRSRCALVTNEVVGPLYLDRLLATLGTAGIEAIPVVLPDGEAHKDWPTLNRVLDALMEARCDRGTPIVALGGGVIGDLAGFCAAVYQRGVPFVQVPTTLLAQVDSSVGGKTAINHPLGKNMVGAFHQPRAVIADTDVLATLPDRELRAGLAEVIKYGLIRDRDFFDWLERHVDDLLAREPAALAYAIRRSCENKAAVVAADERESGVRATLNLGHTFGHAIETGLGYGAWLHGEAVAAGTVMAADLSRRLGHLDQDGHDRAVALLRRAGLPVQGPRMGAERYLELMAHDKKVDSGRLRLILLAGLGRSFIDDQAPREALVATIDACCADA